MAESGAGPLLELTGLRAGYGKVSVLHGIELRVGEGEIVALLGPNGAGKSTLLRAISGLLPATGGLRFDGRSVSGWTPRQALSAGLAHVIEGHRVFTALSVADNLLLAAYGLGRAERLARVEEALESFPEIAARRAERGGALSGGQQQMLAVAQGLVQRPRLLMLDEPSAGLSPVLVDRVLAVLSRLRAAGTAVLLVEQLVAKAAGVADRVCALAQGRMVLEERAGSPGLHERLERAYLGHAPRLAAPPPGPAAPDAGSPVPPRVPVPAPAPAASPTAAP